MDIHEIYKQLLDKYEQDNYKAIFEFCFLQNMYYNEDIVKSLLKETRVTSEIEAADSEPHTFVDLYINKINEDERFEGKNFFDQLKQKNFEKVYSSDLVNDYLSEEDVKCRLATIEILGTDPFKEDPIEERAQLYRNAATILTDQMRKDLPKQKAALSIIRGYQNIEKYQRKINELASKDVITEDDQKSLDQFIKMQKTAQDSINQTAEKNNFTVKGIGSDGKGMLSDVMNQVFEKGIDEGFTNFYDIATSKSIEEIASISMRAQLNQVNLSKTDYADILSTQSAIVKESQSKARDAMEALRLAKEKISKQKLLDELARDYKKKGISEKEIEEFIEREYNLYDGSN